MWIFRSVLRSGLVWLPPKNQSLPVLLPFFYCLIKLCYILNTTSYITLLAGACSGGILLIERQKERKKTE